MKKYFLLSLVLLLTSSLFAVKLADFPDLQKPAFMQVDGDELFFVDGWTIYVYSLKDFKLKFKMAERGQGPGEFGTYPNVVITPDYIMGTGSVKYIKFSRDGKLIEEKKTPRLFRLKPIKNSYTAYVPIYDPLTKPPTNHKSIWLVNANLEKIKKLGSVADQTTNFLRPEDSLSKKFNMLFQYYNWWCHDDKIFIADTQKGLFIDVFDADGNHLYSIDKKIEKVEVGDAFKKKALGDLKRLRPALYERKPKSSFYFTKHFPAIYDFWIDSKKIYVFTFKEKDNKHEIIILDLKGNILDRVFVPLKSFKHFKFSGSFASFTIHKNALYEIFDNEETEMWELHKIVLPRTKK